jgi:quinol monooxygenase YgiN
MALSLALGTILGHSGAGAQERKPMVRMAKIVVDSTHLEQFRSALKEAIETAVRVEPGVLSLNAVYDKDHPTHVTVFEVYADKASYEAHLQTPHFKKYKETTKDMVKSLELVDVIPIAHAEKSGH